MPTSTGPRTTLALSVALAVTTLCCALPLGLPAIVYAFKARAAVKVGDIDAARRQTRTSLALSAAGAVAGLLFEAFFLVRHLARGFQ